MTEAFENIFKTEKRVPQQIQTADGNKFINKQTQALFKSHDIHWFSTRNETKAQICERFNRTLKGKMWKYFTAVDTIQWRPILQDLITNYNNSHHRSIKMTPEEGSRK